MRVLASDGIEAEATEVGSFVVPLGGPTSLRVLRIQIAGGDESELEIFFRDESNGDGTYPAGRFVSLHPLSNGQFRLDFNRARNPFCAYSSVYPCPAPWRGNTLSVAIRAGERYSGGGLQAVPGRAAGGMMLALAIQAALGLAALPPAEGTWRAVLDLAGGPLRFALQIETFRWLARTTLQWHQVPADRGARIEGDSLVLDIADYAATITAALQGDSLTGATATSATGARAPFRFGRREDAGRSPGHRKPSSAVGTPPSSSDWKTSPRVFEF